MSYNKFKAAKKKIELCKYKGGVKCNKCGYNKNISALSFHHIKPKNKKFKISLRECFAYSIKKLKEEADKCEVLCINCHINLHSKAHKQNIIPYINESYRKHKQDRCDVCNEKIKEFKKKYCSLKCKHNSKMFKNSSKRAIINRREKRKEYLIKLKGGACEKCNYKKNKNCLVFHHRDPSNKLFNLSKRSLSSNKMEKIIHEVQKCDLLCHNCHNEVHYPELDLEKLKQLNIF